MFLPAFPHSPAAGAANAAVLNDVPGTTTDRPVASARTVLLTAVPETCERFPPTVAVSGVPERRLMSPLTVQSFIRAPFQPFTSVPPARSIPLLYWNRTERLCRASKLESPRSAERSSQFCATGVLPCPRPPVPALSMDFENW